MLSVETLKTLAPLAASDALSIGDVSVLLLALDAEMAKPGLRGCLLRVRYRKMWGVAWRPLLTDAIDAAALDSERRANSLTMR